MRCGRCKEVGVTVDHVKNCYREERFIESGLEKVPESNDAPMWPASEKQIDYVIGLQDERMLPDNWMIYERDQLRKMERDEVSAVITALKMLPKPDGAVHQPEWSMPAGRYALQGDADDAWRFYLVDRPESGRWKGYTFLNQLIGAPGDYRKEPIKSKPVRESILRRIEEDPETAMIDFGLYSGYCGMCGSPLTNEESLARGIGPICAGKMGW